MVFSAVGEIRLFAGTYEPRGWAFCDGRLLDIGSNRTLYELIGFIYGSNADLTRFAVPTISAPPGLHYMIATAGEFPRSLDGYIGAIKLFAGLNVPDGWLPCDGRIVTVDPQNVNSLRLALTLGATYGGDGTTTVGLPLVGPVASAIPGAGNLTPEYIVCVKGQLALKQGDNFASGRVEEFVGEVGAFAGSYVPADLLPANGQTLTFQDAPALATVIGGGKSTFQLPNLPGLLALNPSDPSQVLKAMAYLVALRGIFPARD